MLRESPEDLSALTEEAKRAFNELRAFYYEKFNIDSPELVDVFRYLDLYQQQSTALYRALIASGNFEKPQEGPVNADEFCDLWSFDKVWALSELDEFREQMEMRNLLAKVVGKRLASYFGHDLNNLQLLSVWHDVTGDIFHRDYHDDILVDNPEALKKDRAFLEEIFMKITSDPEKFIRFMGFPMEALRAEARHENDMEIEVEDLDLAKMVEVANILVKLRFYQGGQLPIDFELDIDPRAKLKANYGMVMSVLYNLFKNGGKALKKRKDEGMEKDGNDPKMLTKVARHSKLGMTMIFVADNGCGVDQRVILDQACKMLDEGLGEKIRKVAPAAYKALVRWRSNPFAMNGVEWGEILQLLFVQTLSGFNLVDVTSSGLGLNGAEYIVEAMGGKIIAATVEGGGMLFGILLPEDVSSGTGGITQVMTKAKLEKVMGQGWMSSGKNKAA